MKLLRRLPLIKELIIVGSTYLLYISTGDLIHKDVLSAGQKNAIVIIEIEELLGIFREHYIQAWWLANIRSFTIVMNWIYTAGFWPIVGTVSIYVFFKDRDLYYRYRTTMISCYLIGVAIYCIFPLSPPKTVQGFGFVDTIALFGPSQYHLATDTISYNANAAMPSMHVGLSIILSMTWSNVRSFSTRIVPTAYVSLMCLAVIVTGNHYFLDILAVLPIVWLAIFISKKCIHGTERYRYL